MMFYSFIYDALFEYRNRYNVLGEKLRLHDDLKRQHNDVTFAITALELMLCLWLLKARKYRWRFLEPAAVKDFGITRFTPAFSVTAIFRHHLLVIFRHHLSTSFEISQSQPMQPMHADVCSNQNSPIRITEQKQKTINNCCHIFKLMSK